MPETTIALDVQLLGKNLVEMATILHPWAPAFADRMRSHIEQARQSMSKSQYLVVANLMLACEEFRSAIETTHNAGLAPGRGSREIERLNRLICEATNQRLYTSQSPEF